MDKKNLLTIFVVIILIAIAGFLGANINQALAGKELGRLNDIIRTRDADLGQCRASIADIAGRSRTIASGLDSIIIATAKITDRNDRIIRLVGGLKDAIRELRSIVESVEPRSSKTQN